MNRRKHTWTTAIRLTLLTLAVFVVLSVTVRPSSDEDQLAIHAEPEQDGVTFAIQYLGEVYSVVSGGVENGTRYLHLVNTPITFDLSSLAGLNGASVYLNSQWATGGSPSELAGDLQTVSNSDAPNTWKISEAYFQQTLFNQRLGLLAGLFDLNSEFDVIERGGLFINSSFGIGPDYSQSGDNGPSIFPTTSLGLRVQAQLHNNLTVRAAAFDGVAGDPDDPYGTKVILRQDDGLLVSGEAELTPELVPGFRTVVGVWFYTEPSTPHIESTAPGRELRNRGGYIIGESTVWADDNSDREVGVFVRYGRADNRINQLGDYIGFGVVATSLFSRDHSSTVGLGIAIARNGRDYQDAMSDAAVAVDRTETAIELTASLSLHEYFTIQPDVQYIVNPGTDPALDNALAIGLRLDFSM